MMSTRTEKCDANFGSSCMLNPGIYSDSVPYTIRSMTLLLCCAFHKPSSGTISSVSIFVIEPYQYCQDKAQTTPNCCSNEAKV